VLIVLDTNVLVSALLNPFGTPARVLDQVLSDIVQLAFDDRILAEYSEVLKRPRFGFPASGIQALLNHIQLNGRQIAAAPAGLRKFPDPGDLPFAEVALSAPAEVLVTGNLSHFRALEGRGIPVLTPSEFMDGLEQLIRRSRPG